MMNRASVGCSNVGQNPARRSVFSRSKDWPGLTFAAISILALLLGLGPAAYPARAGALQVAGVDPAGAAGSQSLDGQTAARNIIITVDIGRKSKDCIGFGVCSITIDASLRTRSVQAAAAWVNGRLQLNFLSDPADKGDLLTIDEDIVLDSATSHALGFEQVSVRGRAVSSELYGQLARAGQS